MVDGIMRETTNREYNEEEEAQAAINIWKYALGFTEMAVVKCAIELGIADVLEKNGGSMTISELSSTLRCPQSYLYRVMRFLAHLKIFNLVQTSQDTVSYAQTPISHHLMIHSHEGRAPSMGPLIMLENNPVMLAPWLRLSSRIRDDKTDLTSPFTASHGDDLWGFGANNPSQRKLFNDAMASDARVVVPRIVKGCPNLFDGVGTVVDVGGGDGTTLSILVKAFPWIEGINFDLPHVVSDAPIQSERLKHVGGNMFVSVPQADVVLLKWVLHDWNDEECIEILRKCKEAIADKERGKVIIVEAVIEEDNDESNDEYNHKLNHVGLLLDMVMMAHTTNGKERTLKEWNHLLNKVGFTHVHVNSIQAVQSVIEAYPTISLPVIVI